jgi:hypothetical protein
MFDHRCQLHTGISAWHVGDMLGETCAHWDLSHIFAPCKSSPAGAPVGAASEEDRVGTLLNLDVAYGGMLLQPSHEVTIRRKSCWSPPTL